MSLPRLSRHGLTEAFTDASPRVNLRNKIGCLKHHVIGSRNHMGAKYFSRRLRTFTFLYCRPGYQPIRSTASADVRWRTRHPFDLPPRQPQPLLVVLGWFATRTLLRLCVYMTCALVIHCNMRHGVVITSLNDVGPLVTHCNINHVAVTHCNMDHVVVTSSNNDNITEQPARHSSTSYNTHTCCSIGGDPPRSSAPSGHGRQWRMRRWVDLCTGGDHACAQVMS